MIFFIEGMLRKILQDQITQIVFSMDITRLQ